MLHITSVNVQFRDTLPFHVEQGDWVAGTVGSRLKEAMQEARRNNAEVAKAAGVHEKTVSQWRSDRQEMKPDNIDAVAEFLGVSKAWLRYGDENGRLAEPPARPYGEFQPNPRYERELPGRVYAAAREYLDRLIAIERLGVGELEEAERLLMDSRYARRNKREGGGLSEDEWIMLVDDAWDAIREVLSWQGIRP